MKLLFKNVRTETIFILVFVISALVFLAHYWVVGSGVWGDARYYYSFLRSAIIDGDLNFANEATYFSFPQVLTQTGLVANKFSIASVILWLPFFLLAHLISLLLSIKADGYGHLYQILVGIGSVAYANLGLYLVFKTIKLFFKRNISLLTILGIFFASNLFFYSSVDPINSHSLSFFVSAALFYTCFKYLNSKKLDWKLVALLGIEMGMLAMIRNQDIILGLLPLALIIKKEILVFTGMTRVKRGKILKLTCSQVRMTLKKSFGKLLIFGLSIFTVFIPQFLVWQYLYGQIASPYMLSGEKFYWLNPQIINTLFSSNSGLFFYSPILVFSIVGLIWLRKKDKILSTICLTIFLVQLYLIASWHSWWGGESYGNRMFISLMPIFIMGLAFFINQIKKSKLITWSIIFLVSLNFAMIIKYLLST
jgi:hypothetical protein